MTRVNTNFTFHNVGQGLFYSGEISSTQNIFRFIYDCGSFQRGLVYSAIKHFKNEIDKNNRVINLLILSHLHADHTSGLNDLFHYFKVEEVVLPYFTPIERLLIALRTVNMPGWYYKFLADPVPFLMERGVERIIIIGEGEGGEEKAPPSEFPPPGERISSGINIKKLPDDENLKRTVFENDTNWQDIDEQKLLFKTHDGYITLIGLWLIRFFNYKISPSSRSIDEFKECLGTQGLRSSDNKDIKRTIMNKERLKNLKECYNFLARKLSRDFNNTSLVVYHGPVSNIRGKIDKLCFGPRYTPALLGPYCYLSCSHLSIRSADFKNYGQLLTGDISLNLKYKELTRHYFNYLKTVVVGQVPHHGAGKNWNENLLKETPNSVFWIIPAGFRNIYGHPSLKVIENIFSNGKRCVWVNELCRFSITSKIEIK